MASAVARLAGPGLRRRDGRLQLQLCRNELDADAARLDRLTYPRARLQGWRTGAAGAPTTPRSGSPAPTGMSPALTAADRSEAQMTAYPLLRLGGGWGMRLRTDWQPIGPRQEANCAW